MRPARDHDHRIESRGSKMRRYRGWTRLRGLVSTVAVTVLGCATVGKAFLAVGAVLIPGREILDSVNSKPEGQDPPFRPLGEERNLAASLSQVITRQVDNDYTIRLDGKVYRMVMDAVPAGLRGAVVRVEQRLKPRAERGVLFQTIDHRHGVHEQNRLLRQVTDF